MINSRIVYRRISNRIDWRIIFNFSQCISRGSKDNDTTIRQASRAVTSYLLDPHRANDMSNKVAAFRKCLRQRAAEFRVTLTSLYNERNCSSIITAYIYCRIFRSSFCEYKTLSTYLSFEHFYYTCMLNHSCFGLMYIL